MYEATNEEIMTRLSNGNPQVFTEETIALINTLAVPAHSDGGVGKAKIDDQPVMVIDQKVSIANGTGIVFVPVGAAGTSTNVKLSGKSPVVIFEGQGGVNVEFNDPTGSGYSSRVVVGSDGGNRITVKDKVNSAITAGAGNDTIVSGSGNDTISAGRGNDRIDAGTGFDVVKLAASAGNIQASVVDGALVLTNTATGVVVRAKNTEYVQLDGGKAIIAVETVHEAAIAMLYEAYRPYSEVPRESTADAEGLHYWLNRFWEGDTLSEISQEFAVIFGVAPSTPATASAITDDQFLANMYENVFGRTNVAQTDASGWEYWTERMDDGASRADVAAQFAEIAAQNFDSTTVTSVGYIKIIDGLI